MDDCSSDSSFQSWKDDNFKNGSTKHTVHLDKPEVVMQSNGSDLKSEDEFTQIQMIAAGANHRSGRETMKNSPKRNQKIKDNRKQ